jgi:ribosomal protein S18 acetylase RimI-like enzyme
VADGSDTLIRDAAPADAAALAPLLAELGYPAAAEVIEARRAALLATDSTARVLVAVRDGRVVGFATLHATPVLHRPTPVGRITGIAVLPGTQGHGVGRLLVEAAEAHFARLGLGRMEVTSGPTHERAYPFYRRLGYHDQGIRFAKPLGDS